MTDENITQIVEGSNTPETAPTAPTTTVSGFIYSLGELSSDLRKRFRMSENGSLKLIQNALEYDLNRRAMRGEKPVGEAINE